MPMHCRQQKDKPVLLRELIHSAVEMRLKFAGGGQILRGRSRQRLRPKGFAHFAALRRTRSVNGKPKRDPHKPCAKSRAIAQSLEAPVRTQQRFLRDVFGIRAVAQHSSRDAICQWPAFREPLLEFAPKNGCSRFLRELLLNATAWLDQNQLLHWVFYASRERSPSPYTRQTPRQVVWFIIDHYVRLFNQ